MFEFMLLICISGKQTVHCAQTAFDPLQWKAVHLSRCAICSHGEDITLPSGSVGPALQIPPRRPLEEKYVGWGP